MTTAYPPFKVLKKPISCRGFRNRPRYLLHESRACAQVTAIVPQPVTRKSDGTLEQSRNTIEVYFNDDDLDITSAQTQRFIS